MNQLMNQLMKDALEFVEDLHSCCAQENDQIKNLAPGLALRETNALLNYGLYDELNTIFKELDVNKLTYETIVAMLLFTRFEPEKMPAREEFFKRAVEKATAANEPEELAEIKEFYR